MSSMINFKMGPKTFACTFSWAVFNLIFMILFIFQKESLFVLKGLSLICYFRNFVISTAPSFPSRNIHVYLAATGLAFEYFL